MDKPGKRNALVKPLLLRTFPKGSAGVISFSRTTEKSELSLAPTTRVGDVHAVDQYSMALAENPRLDELDVSKTPEKTYQSTVKIFSGVIEQDDQGLEEITLSVETHEKYNNNLAIIAQYSAFIESLDSHDAQQALELLDDPDFCAMIIAPIGYRAFMQAASKGQFSVVAKILKLKGIDGNFMRIRFSDALRVVALENRTDILELLLAHEYFTQWRKFFDMRTIIVSAINYALHGAIQRDNTRSVSILVDYNPDNKRKFLDEPKHMREVLFLAAKYCAINSLNILLNSCSDAPLAVASMDYRVLHYACGACEAFQADKPKYATMAQHTAMVIKLLSIEVDQKAILKDNAGSENNQALRYAIVHNCLEVVKALLSCHDVRIKLQADATAAGNSELLFLVKRSGNLEIIQELLKVYVIPQSAIDNHGGASGVDTKMREKLLEIQTGLECVANANHDKCLTKKPAFKI